MLLAMFDWGLRWHGAEAAHAQVLHKPCGQSLQIAVVCAHCRQIALPREVEVRAGRAPQ